MFESSRPRIPVDVVRDQLAEFVEQSQRGSATFDLDHIVADYLDRFGPMPIDRAPIDALMQITRSHLLEDPAPGERPSWCEVKHRFGYDSVDSESGRDMRDHGRTLSPHVDLTLTEFEDEPLFSQPILLQVCVDPVPMSAAQVRMLAAELLNGADELDKVTGSVQWTEDGL